MLALILYLLDYAKTNRQKEGATVCGNAFIYYSVSTHFKM